MMPEYTVIREIQLFTDAEAFGLIALFFCIGCFVGYLFGIVNRYFSLDITKEETLDIERTARKLVMTNKMVEFKDDKLLDEVITRRVHMG